MKKSNLKFGYEVNLATSFYCLLCTACNRLTFSNEYFLAYKGSSEVGAGTLLDNEITFEEFLKDYKCYISNNKKVMIIVTMKDKKKDKKKREYKDDNLELEVTSEETEEEALKFKSVKTKKKFKNNTDFETPPNHAIFSMLHSVKPTSYNSNNKNSLTIPNVIQNFTIEVPSMKEFLEELDRKYGANKFTCYLQKFEEEEIRVNQLFRLSDAEYNLIGISKIGIRQTLRDESKKFE
ncbi:unnamed protein product [Rhizophagus irregularis]|nr:unnamed protein product [Rhizophagus irregularis]